MTPPTAWLEPHQHPRIDPALLDCEQLPSQPPPIVWDLAGGEPKPFMFNRKNLRQLLGLRRKAEGLKMFPRSWCTLMYNSRKHLWQLSVPSEPMAFLLAIGTDVCAPGRTYRVRNGDRLVFGVDLGSENEQPLGCVDIRLEGEGAGAGALADAQVPARSLPLKRRKSAEWTCGHDHGGHCSCDHMGQCQYCRRCDACRAKEFNSEDSAAVDVASHANSISHASSAPRPPRDILLPKKAQQLRREVCDVTYPENPPNKRLVLMIEEMEKYERAFNGEDKRWRPGERKRGITGQVSYVNARALALRHAAAALRAYSKLIIGEDDLQQYQARGITHIGPSLELQVRSFLQRLRAATEAAAETAGETEGEEGEEVRKEAAAAAAAAAAATAAMATSRKCCSDAASEHAVVPFALDVAAVPNETEQLEWTPDLDRELQLIVTRSGPAQWAAVARQLSLTAGLRSKFRACDVRDRWVFSCDKLDALRRDDCILDAEGKPRMQDIGSVASKADVTQLKVLANCASLARLQKILGVGYLRSHQWLDKHNVRSITDVRAAVADGRLRLSPAQADGVAYYEDIRTTPLLRSEIEEMQAVVRTSLERVARSDPRFALFEPDAWRVLAGGGYRRGNNRFHDADFLVSHPQLRFGCDAERAPGGAATLLELVLKDISDHHTVHGGYRVGSQIAQRSVQHYNTDSEEDELAACSRKTDDSFARSVSYGPSNGGRTGGRAGGDCDGFMMWQTRRMDGSYANLLRSSADTDRGFENMDLLDRFFGLWHWPRSGSGFKERKAYVRRVDLVIVPVEQWGFAVLGWTGSRQWNRSVRDYARRVRGLSLTSHAAVTIAGKLDMMMEVPDGCEPGDLFRVGFDQHGLEHAWKLTRHDSLFANTPATGYNERVYEVVARPRPTPAEQCGVVGKEVSDLASGELRCGEWCRWCGRDHGPVLWARHYQTRVIGVGSGAHYTHSAGKDHRDPPDVVEIRGADGPALGMMDDGAEPERAVLALLKIGWVPPAQRHA